MKYLSVCAGIEAATVAWHELGWTPTGFSEIEKFPSSVLQHHYPTIENYGDMNDFRKWPRTDIDVLVGGTPCQSFSLAGLRGGMADPRGNLALVYLAIAERLRPTWLVWENVPGVLSSDGGRDFGSIIGGMVELGYSPSWRVLDAQYFGVPQRRRRVFVVGCLGGWQRAAKVLFEPACLRRDPPPSREASQRVTSTLRGRPPGSGGQGTDGEQTVANCLHAHQGISQPDFLNMIPETAKAVRSMSGGVDREDMHTLVPDTVGAICADSHPGSYTGQDAYTGRLFPVAAPLTAGSSSGNGVNPPGRRQEDDHNLVAFAQNQRDEVREMPVAGALAAEPGAKQQTYVFKPGQSGEARSDAVDEHIAPTLSSGSGGNQVPAAMHEMAVRRLTPLECERLQGFPDGYTDIPGASDSARYRALGNSMAVPVMRWIGERIRDIESR